MTIASTSTLTEVAAAVAIARVEQVDMPLIQQWSSDGGVREPFEEFRDAVMKT